MEDSGATEQACGKGDVLALHGLEEDQLLEEKDQFHLSVFQVRLESVFLLLHLSDFIVEGLNNFFDVFFLLFLFEDKFDVADLSEFSIDIGLLSLGVLSSD